MSVSTSAAGLATWQQELADAIRDPAELIGELDLPRSLLPAAKEAAGSFGLVVPRGFVRRMERGNPRDPLLMQVLPIGAELTSPPGFGSDPLQEAFARRSPGLIQKYRGRVLLIAAGQCAINCRYCFRREYPYQDEPRGIDEWEPAIEAIRRDETLSEVILSGGDPLLRTDSWIGRLIDRIESVPHVSMLRIHSRLPIVLPARVTSGLVKRLTASRLQPVMVVHSNHPNELSDDCCRALQRFVGGGIPTLNQAVLLRGINDQEDTQISLSRRLIGTGVIPYYLHILDRVRGTAHFEVATDRGREIVEQMRRRLPGYAVPRLVVEQPGVEHKTVIL